MINATVELGVEDSVLIKYLVDELGISAAKKHAQSPVFMMFSVLSLALSSYKDLKANPQGMSHDEQYKHLFYTTLWVATNSQSLFQKNEQVALLHYLSQSMRELSKVVSYQTVLAVMSDFEAVQTLTVEFICF